MSDDFVDPGEPGELSSGMRAKDLLNKPLLIRPNSIETGDGKDDAGNATKYEYVSCDVWVLDRQGVVETGNNVQFSWKRAMPQLTDRIGQFVGATPRRQEDNSVILQAFSDAGKDIARSAIKEILTVVGSDAPQVAPESEYSEDVF